MTKTKTKTKTDRHRFALVALLVACSHGVRTVPRPGGADAAPPCVAATCQPSPPNDAAPVVVTDAQAVAIDIAAGELADGGASSACGPIDSGKPGGPAGKMFVERFVGPVTLNEVNSFKSYIHNLTPAPDNMGNAWAQHESGQQTKAMGLLYEVARDVTILDKMIVFCDAVLSERNDLAAAPVGQHVLWTGRVEPAWPNNTATPVTAAGEQGDPVGHLGNCARLILETPSIWSDSVPDGDPKGYGHTYLARAKKYMTEADFALDQFILKSLLDVSDKGRQRWSASLPSGGSGEVPWNQQMMFNYGFQNLAVAHAILGDDPSRVARYDALVQGTMDWFFQSGGVTLKTDAKGNPSYLWGYLPSNVPEDNSHGNLDVAGFYRAFTSGRYHVTDAMMTPFANTFLDIMMRGAQDYAGRVDGTDGSGNSAPTNYVRADYLDLSEFRTDAYLGMLVGARLQEGAATGSIDAFSRFAWMKTRRCLRGIH